MGILLFVFQNFYQKNGKIDTIERDEARANEAIQNIKLLGLEDKIEVFIGDAVDVLPTFNKKYDMIFIDAAKGKYPFFLNEALRMSNSRKYNYS